MSEGMNTTRFGEPCRGYAQGCICPECQEQERLTMPAVLREVSVHVRLKGWRLPGDALRNEEWELDRKIDAALKGRKQ